MTVLKRLGMIAMALVGTGLLYVLSIGPMAWASERGRLPKKVEEAAEILYQPLHVVEETPLEVLLLRYMDWWVGD